MNKENFTNALTNIFKKIDKILFSKTKYDYILEFPFILSLIPALYFFITDPKGKDANTYILYIIAVASIYAHKIIYCVADNFFKHINIIFNKNKKERTKRKSLIIYGIFFISYFTALFLTGKLKLYYEYLNKQSSTPSKTANTDKMVIFDYLGLGTTIFTIFTISAIIALSLDLIKSKRSFVICIILSISVLATPTFFSNKDYIFSIFFSLSYLFSLIVYYNIINKLPDLYNLLHTNGKLDFAKLTLLWTIIVFLLGVFFDIKP